MSVEIQDSLDKIRDYYLSIIIIIEVENAQTKNPPLKYIHRCISPTPRAAKTMYPAL